MAEGGSSKVDVLEELDENQENEVDAAANARIRRIPIDHGYYTIVRVSGPNLPKRLIQVKPHSTMKKLMRVYSEHCGVPLRELRFTYFGTPLIEYATAPQLNMQYMHIIRVIRVTEEDGEAEDKGEGEIEYEEGEAVYEEDDEYEEEDEREEEEDEREEEEDEREEEEVEREEEEDDCEEEEDECEEDDDECEEEESECEEEGGELADVDRIPNVDEVDNAAVYGAGRWGLTNIYGIPRVDEVDKVAGYKRGRCGLADIDKIPEVNEAAVGDKQAEGGEEAKTAEGGEEAKTAEGGEEAKTAEGGEEEEKTAAVQISKAKRIRMIIGLEEVDENLTR